MLKEQKGYKCLKILIDLTNYTGNHDLLIKPLLYYSILYDEIHIKSEDQTLIKFITNEFNKTIIIINITDKIDDINYQKIFYITDRLEINAQLEINNEDINRFLI
jgi:GTP-binding protein EngB required for normal cell division